MERRDRLGIIADILDIAKDGVKKTEMMYKANLSFKQAQDYSKALTSCKLLYVNGNDGSVVYQTSEKGNEFVKRHRNLKGFLKA